MLFSARYDDFGVAISNRALRSLKHDRVHFAISNLIWSTLNKGPLLPLNMVWLVSIPWKEVLEDKKNACLLEANQVEELGWSFIKVKNKYEKQAQTVTSSNINVYYVCED